VRILSTSDLHGNEDQYRMLKKEAKRNQTDVVIIFE
jgi:Icc-related predicted phosphoesterase